MLNKEQIKYTQLYTKLKRELTLQGKEVSTREAYLRSFRKASKYFQRCPDDLTVEELKGYFAELVSRYAWNTVKIERCGLQFFYKYVIQKKWSWVEIFKPPRVKYLPDVLSMKEIDIVLNLIKKPRYRVCLFTIYSMGLRLGEALKLQVGDIDKQRMLVHIRSAKGNKDRFIPIPHLTRRILGAYWKTHQNPILLFPSMHAGTQHAGQTKLLMDRNGLRCALRAALREAKIFRRITIHSLRHSYATHLVELGVNLSVIQKYLGHRSPITTVIYTHLSKPAHDNSVALINQHMLQFSWIK